MTGEEFAHELKTWKQEFEESVISHYRADDRERGQLAFDRWKERFKRFLSEHTSSDADRFEEETHLLGLVIRHGEHPYEQFMREYGRKCYAFIDDLAEAAIKGHIYDLGKQPAASSKVFASSPKVFLSYVREDSKPARKLYDDLRVAGAEVWFDKVSLLGGQQWKPAIKQAIRDSRFFIALLSTNSVGKKGYAQKELKDALDTLDEYPSSDVYLIPVHLDDCRPSDIKLQDLQWIDMFPKWKEGLAQILATIESHMK